MQEVQALTRLRPPPETAARTDWMFGFQRRGVRRCEWDTDMPKPGPLPHTSHTAATVDHSQKIGPAEVRSRCRRTPRGRGDPQAPPPEGRAQPRTRWTTL